MLADKPQIEELRYFLEFQVPRVWAPVQDRFPGQQRKEPVCPHLQFSMMGQKLYVSQEQVCRFLNLEIEFLSNVNLIYTDGENDKFCPVSLSDLSLPLQAPTKLSIINQC